MDVSRFYLHLCAPNDRNGNPRRLYVGFGQDGEIIGVWNEGYQGKPSALRGAMCLVEVDISPTAYRVWVQQAKGLNIYEGA